MQVRIVVKKNEFPSAPGKMAGAVGKAFATLGPKLLSTMQEATPVDTGRLRGSETQTASAKELRLRASTEYALYVEMGTRKMAAQPYMKPTVEGATGEIASEISAAASAAFG